MVSVKAGGFHQDGHHHSLEGWATRVNAVPAMRARPMATPACWKGAGKGLGYTRAGDAHLVNVGGRPFLARWLCVRGKHSLRHVKLSLYVLPTTTQSIAEVQQVRCSLPPSFPAPMCRIPPPLTAAVLLPIPPLLRTLFPP